MVWAKKIAYETIKFIIKVLIHNLETSLQVISQSYKYPV